MVRTRVGHRKDSNHNEIRDLLVELGCQVTDTHMVGGGFPDMVATGWGQVALVEVKDGEKPPSKRKLTKDEAAWHQRCGATVHIVERPKDAIDVAEEMWMCETYRLLGEDAWRGGTRSAQGDAFAVIREKYNL